MQVHQAVTNCSTALLFEELVSGIKNSWLPKIQVQNFKIMDLIKSLWKWFDAMISHEIVPSNEKKQLLNIKIQKG